MKIPIIRLVIIILLLLPVFSLSTPNSQTGTKAPEKTMDYIDNPRISITSQQAWALSCAALLTERNHARHDLLGTKYRTPKNIENCKHFLVVSGWDITNKNDLLDSLSWIYDGGHRQGFKMWGEKVQTLSTEEYQKLLAEYQSDSEMLNRIKIAAKYYTALNDKSLFGWDYSRYICLCRWGYLAGYLTEEEAWEKIIPVAMFIQNKFDSWQDLGQNYLIGRQYWSYEDTKLCGYLYEDAYLRLLDMPSSPWNKLPWNMNLTKEQTAPGSGKADINRKN